MRPMPVLCPGTAGTPPASYAREPRAQPPCRHILRVSALPAADSAPGAAMGTASACATPEPLHRLQPLLLDRAEMTSGNPNQTCQAPTARSATPGRGCHRPPRPTFAVTVQEHLKSAQDHPKVCTSTPNLSSAQWLAILHRLNDPLRHGIGNAPRQSPASSAERMADARTLTSSRHQEPGYLLCTQAR